MRSLRSGFRQSLMLAAITIGGTTAVFFGVALMNRSVVQRQPLETTAPVSFTVSSVQPRQAEKHLPLPRKPSLTPAPKLAPVPDFGGQRSSVQIEMPAFAPESFTEASSSLLGDLEHIELTEDTVDVKPTVRSNPLTYPPLAKKRQIEGRVLVCVLIDAEGKVKKVRILESDPPGVFDDTVLQALPQWLFTPAQYRGETVPVWATIPLVFELL